MSLRYPDFEKVHTRSASSWGVGPLSLMIRSESVSSRGDPYRHDVLRPVTMDGALVSSEKPIVGLSPLLVHPDR